jgi:hypothetical protein
MSDNAPFTTPDRTGIAVGRPVSERPVWRRPTYSILDVEAGTVATSGPVSDGNGSTS